MSPARAHAYLVTSAPVIRERSNPVAPVHLRNGGGRKSQMSGLYQGHLYEGKCPSALRGECLV